MNNLNELFITKDITIGLDDVPTFELEYIPHHRGKILDQIDRRDYVRVEIRTAESEYATQSLIGHIKDEDEKGFTLINFDSVSKSGFCSISHLKKDCYTMILRLKPLSQNSGQMSQKSGQGE